jgi:hypothetical protein
MCPLPVPNGVTVRHQEAVTVCAAYCIYRAENILKLCKITYKYIVAKSIEHRIVGKVSDYIKRFFG